MDDFKLLHIGDRSSSVESSSSLGRRSDADPPTSRPWHAAAPLDAVDLWDGDDSCSDSEPLIATTGVKQTAGDEGQMTTDDDAVRERCSRGRQRSQQTDGAERGAGRDCGASANCNPGPTNSSLAVPRFVPCLQQLPAEDDRTAGSTRAAAAAAGACRWIPTIIESGGRPATANGSAAELSHGSVVFSERRPPLTGAVGLDLFVTGSDERTTRSEVKVTQAAAECTRFNDVRSSASITVQSKGFV